MAKTFWEQVPWRATETHRYFPSKRGFLGMDKSLAHGGGRRHDERMHCVVDDSVAILRQVSKGERVSIFRPDGRDKSTLILCAESPVLFHPTFDQRNFPELVFMSGGRVLMVMSGLGCGAWLYCEGDLFWTRFEIEEAPLHRFSLVEDHDHRSFCESWDDSWLSMPCCRISLKIPRRVDETPNERRRLRPKRWTDSVPQFDESCNFQGLPDGFVVHNLGPQDWGQPLVKYVLRDGNPIRSWSASRQLASIASVRWMGSRWVVLLSHCVSKTIDVVLHETGERSRTVRVPGSYFSSPGGMVCFENDKLQVLQRRRNSLWKIHEPTLAEICSIVLCEEARSNRPVLLPPEAIKLASKFDAKHAVYNPRAKTTELRAIAREPRLAFPPPEKILVTLDAAESKWVWCPGPAGTSCLSFDIDVNITEPPSNWYFGVVLRFSFWTRENAESPASQTRCGFKASWNAPNTNLRPNRRVWSKGPSRSGSAILTFRWRSFFYGMEHSLVNLLVAPSSRGEVGICFRISKIKL